LASATIRQIVASASTTSSDNDDDAFSGRSYGILNLRTIIPDGSRIIRPKQKDAIDKSLESTLRSIPDTSRRKLYDVLQPLDRGDFRYDFLVPWVEEGTLTSFDKFIITTSFVGVSFAIQWFVENARGASVGVHASLIVQFFSYAVGNPIFFRLLAIVSSVIEIAGNLLEVKENGLFTMDVLHGAQLVQQRWWEPTTEDVFPVAYNLLFLVINGYYVILWALSNDAFAAPAFTPEQEEVYTQSFGPLGLRRAQYARLLKSTRFECGSLDETGEGTLLCTEGVGLTELFVPLGPVEVRVGGVVTATLPPFRLVGEAALLESLTEEDEGGNRRVLPSRATIVAPPGVRFARCPHDAFYDLQQEEGSDFRANVQLMIARALSDKLKSARLQAREAALWQKSSAGNRASGGSQATKTAPSTSIPTDLSELSELFDLLDIDGNGQLDREEFSQMVTRAPVSSSLASSSSSSSSSFSSTKEESMVSEEETSMRVPNKSTAEEVLSRPDAEIVLLRAELKETRRELSEYKKKSEENRA